MEQEVTPIQMLYASVKTNPKYESYFHYRTYYNYSWAYFL